jgi:arylsulfatase
MASRIDDFGTPRALQPLRVGWAHAMDAPYQWTKQVASHWGGTRNGTIVHWPARIRAKGRVRSQFHHVIDIAATVLDVAGLPAPATVHGIEQMPLHGVSMTESFDDASATERRTTQYFEMFCNRGIYHKGWTAVTRHSVPWMATEMPAFADDVWELYGPDDWTQAHDIADEEPDKLAELQRLFLDEAKKYNVLPLDDRRFERFNPDLAGRPQLVRGTSQLLFGRMGRLSESSILALKNKSHAITAEIVVPEGGAKRRHSVAGRGVRRLRALRERGRLAYCYNLFGLRRFKVYGDGAIPAGEHQVRMEFTYDGGGLGKGGAVTLFVDGEQVGQGRVEATGANALLRGRDDRRRERHRDAGERRLRLPGERVHGRVRWVQLDIDEAAEDVDHLISPEERLQIAMAGSSVAGPCCAPSSGRSVQGRPRALLAVGGATPATLVRSKGGSPR